MLDKGNRKSAYYKVGDKITFFKKGSRHKVAAEILDLRDSAIVFFTLMTKQNGGCSSKSRNYRCCAAVSIFLPM
jgi:hypothetical protein